MDIKLTQFSHGGGCGCKIAPGILTQLLSSFNFSVGTPELLIGTETADDAAVYQINDSQAIVATTDFFMPIVDDPFDFGRIAATNALSDIYAMGAKPLLALAIVGMPINKLPLEVIQKILEGGQSVCATAGIPIAGGHSIDASEPIYGLAVIGIAHPKKIKRNSGAHEGDILILSKALGVGILSAALKRDALEAEGYQQLIVNTTQLNVVGSALADFDEVHAVTDITGFGLVGHLLGMCKGSQLQAQIEFDKLPLLPAAGALAQRGFATGASDRNWESQRENVTLPKNFPEWKKKILTDPQTSGGLLVSCSQKIANDVIQLFHTHGFKNAAQVGKMFTGPAHIVLR